MKRTQSTLIIKADGTEQTVARAMTMEELRQAVGGYVELTTCIYQEQRVQMLVNEDGHSQRLPYNRRATEMFLAARKPGSTDYIVGDAAVLINWKLD